MFELLILFGLLFLGACALVGLLKFLVAVVLLPFKLAIVMTKGLLLLFVGIPFLILSLVVVGGALPILGFVLMVPVLLGAAAIAGLARFIF